MGEKETHNLCVSNILKNQKHLLPSWAACWLRAVVGRPGPLSSVPLTTVTVAGTSCFCRYQRERERAEHPNEERKQQKQIWLNQLPSTSQPRGLCSSGRETCGWKICSAQGWVLTWTRNNRHVPLNSGSCINSAKRCCREIINKEEGDSAMNSLKMKTRVLPWLTFLFLIDSTHHSFLHFSQGEIRASDFSLPFSSLYFWVMGSI